MIVVLSLVSVFLFFSFPAFVGLLEDSENDTDTLISLIRSARTTAVRDNRDIFLHVDGTANSIRMSTEGETDTDGETAAAWKGGGIRIKDVAFPFEQDPDQTAPVIGFYKTGISDPAIIQVEAGARQISLRIEPFLPDIQIISGFVTFNDCD